jgi:hypothetical protein
LGYDAGASYPGKREHRTQERGSIGTRRNPYPDWKHPTSRRLDRADGNWCFLNEEDEVAAGIRNLREVKNAERFVIGVRRWSIVPRRILRGRFGEGRFVQMVAAFLKRVII